MSRNDYKPRKGQPQDSFPAPEAEKAPSPPNLHDLLNAVLGQRDIVCVGDWISDSQGFAQEPVYLVAGTLVTALEELEWGEINQKFGAVEVVDGMILARNVVVNK